MAYCTPTDIELQVGTAILVQLTNDNPEQNTIDQAVCEEVLIYSSTLIDGYLRGKYHLPLSSHYPLLRIIAIDLSIYRLYSRRIYTEIPETVLNAYKNAIKTLEDLKKAYEYYTLAYNLGNSWAANKLGERERLNKNYKEAFKYYNDALNVPINNVYFWSFYNLAKYYYLDGNSYAYVDKDINKAIEYFEKASDFGILEASLELLVIYSTIYIKNKNNDTYLNLLRIVNRIEKHENYNNELKDRINNILKDIKNNKHIDLDLLK